MKALTAKVNANAFTKPPRFTRVLPDILRTAAHYARQLRSCMRTCNMCSSVHVCASVAVTLWCSVLCDTTTHLRYAVFCACATGTIS